MHGELGDAVGSGVDRPMTDDIDSTAAVDDGCHEGAAVTGELTAKCFADQRRGRSSRAGVGAL